MDYAAVLGSLKEKIHNARQQASFTVNQELLKMYWEIGSTILEQQQLAGWGARIIDRLVIDLKVEFPDFKGLSARNIKYMRAFAEAYPDFAIVQVPLAQLPVSGKQAKETPVVQVPLAQITWFHHITLLDKVKSPAERLFYIQKTIENGWSRNIMVAQIENNLWNRQGKAITNFSTTLPKPQSDLAIESLKSPYVFDFLGLGEEVKERELEKALIQHIKKFVLELGRGFAYVGNQYNLNVDGDDFFLDLLFFNFHLNSFVVFELKVGDFKPEYAGKLNFYVNTVNEKIKSSSHQPTIGVLLCKTPNDTVVKFALQGIDTPVGVADYELSKALPKRLKGEIPSIEELESVIEKEAANLLKPVDKKVNAIKNIIKDLNAEKVEEKFSEKQVIKIFSKVIMPLKEDIINYLRASEIIDWFDQSEVTVFVDNKGNSDDDKIKELLQENPRANRFHISLNLRGFKNAGTDAFGCWNDIYFYLDDYKYQIKEQHGEKVIIEKLYHKLPSKKEIEQVLDYFSEQLVDQIESNLERVKANHNK